jgi:hypothetical protein
VKIKISSNHGPWGVWEVTLITLCRNFVTQISLTNYIQTPIHATTASGFLHATLLARYDTFLARYVMLLPVTIRFSPVTIRFLHATIRFLHVAIRFLHSTIRPLHATLLFSHTYTLLTRFDLTLKSLENDKHPK